MKCIGIEHCDDGILKPVVLDLEPDDLKCLSTEEYSALDFGMHVIITKNQALELVSQLQASIAEIS